MLPVVGSKGKNLLKIFTLPLLLALKFLQILSYKGYSQLLFQASTLNDQGMNYCVYVIPPRQW